MQRRQIKWWAVIILIFPPAKKWKIMHYKQLTIGERYTIAAYKKQGLSYADIAG